MPGTAAQGNQFGKSLAACDLGLDAGDDLAIGVEDPVNGLASAGAVNVLYGSPTGLTAAAAQRWTMASAGVPGVAAGSDRFGISLGCANYGRTARADLAIGVPFDDLGAQRNAGSVVVMYGRPSALTTTGIQSWTQDSPGVLGTAESVDQLGMSLSP